MKKFFLINLLFILMLIMAGPSFSYSPRSMHETLDGFHSFLTTGAVEVKATPLLYDVRQGHLRVNVLVKAGAPGNYNRNTIALLHSDGATATMMDFIVSTAKAPIPGYSGVAAPALLGRTVEPENLDHFFVFNLSHQEEEKNYQVIFLNSRNLPVSYSLSTYISISSVVLPSFKMIAVGLNQEYTIPTGTNDAGTAQVMGGYEIAESQTTYRLWYAVREWALDNGYTFQNTGREGSAGVDGEPPTEAAEEPVTRVSWRDTIVWLNALSEAKGLDAVYRTGGGDIIRDSRHANGAVVDAALQTTNSGYRLPKSMEWEMAARWKEDTVSIDGSIRRPDDETGRWWTPGSYASGATASYLNVDATGAVVWYNGNSGGKTQPVKTKNPNALGAYDMSGNVHELCFDLTGFNNRVIRGGSWSNVRMAMRIGISTSDVSVTENGHNLGFRIARF